MTKLLLTAATTFEVAPLFKHFGKSISADETLCSFNHNQLNVDIVITGVGMVSTTYHTTKAVLAKKYDFAINVGICGSFNTNLEIGSVVNIYQDAFSELGAEDGDAFSTLAEINLKGVSEVVNHSEIKNEHILALPKVNGITVNTVHGNNTSIEKVFTKFHPITESMEGAAFMLVCENEKIPYVQIRAVSNIVEQRNKNNWNIPLAIEILNKKLIAVINNF